MEKDTLKKLPYNELMELYKAIRDEIRRRNDLISVNIKESQNGTTD